ncbi:unnamed protein product [Durusdinium trenchii]|uniref:Methyltransferase type 11 domain-containing protein n=1 Tax=Durusdinium trenchii TaxID=1381693 RepID=A0ABP0MN45_9DINO
MEFANRGMYGIEVVGAIFLAHFLRLNTSLTTFNFRLNHVEKDGAKALAQSLLGNAQTVLQTVNTMGPTKMKPGIDFGHFKTGHLTTVDLSKRGLDDDDFVFLEEWLRRYDCVTDLNLSWNFMSRDGIRKLTRHIKESKVLTKLNCVGLPVTLEGSALLARAVVENHTLRQVALPLGHCHDTTERQQMIQQFGMGLASHPTLHSFACTRTPNLEYANLNDARENKIKDKAFPPERSGGWPRTQMAVFMWFISALKPDLERLTLGGNGKPKVEYPKEVCQGANPDLIPATLGVLHDAGHRLQQVSIALPLGYASRSMELMRVLTVCGSMRSLKLLGFASASMKESQLPPEWNSFGSAPRWLFEDRLQRKRTHWQALHGLLAALPHLEQFNDLALGGSSMRESPELTCLLLMQCLEGIATDLADGVGGSEALLKANLQADADVDAFCDVLRILSPGSQSVSASATRAAIAAPDSAGRSAFNRVVSGNTARSTGSTKGWRATPTFPLCAVGPAALLLLRRDPRRSRGSATGPSRLARSALTERDTVKMDGFPDELFYLVPRIGVYHVDDHFRAQLTELYRLLLPKGGNLLDLCSQHDSHLPPEVDYTLTVHGMNQLELLANSRASERFTRNFNEDPSLSNLPSNSFDAVLMTVSIQYMQRPVELLKEAARVLKPGGQLIVSFSNRMFFTKAIEIWRAQRNMKGLVNLVLGYVRDAGFEQVRAANGVTLQAPQLLPGTAGFRRPHGATAENRLPPGVGRIGSV